VKRAMRYQIRYNGVEKIVDKEYRYS